MKDLIRLLAGHELTMWQAVVVQFAWVIFVTFSIIFLIEIL